MMPTGRMTQVASHRDAVKNIHFYEELFKVRKITIGGGLLLAFLIAGCSTHKKIIPHEKEKPALEWYNEGVQDYINHDYSEAEHALTMINAQHPGSIYAKRATLILGDVYFAKGDYLLARDYYKRFIKLYPRSKDVIYAKYKIALSYYKARNGYKLDATPVRKAIEAFLELLREYPDNPYKDKINYYLEKCVEELYKHELFVAKFYADLDEFKAAKNRLDYMYRHFKNVNFNDNMLYLMGRVYLALGKRKEAQEFLKQLKEKYPNSKYTKELEKIIDEYHK